MLAFFLIWTDSLGQKRKGAIQLALKVRYSLGRMKSDERRGLFWCTEWVFWSRLQVWEYICGLGELKEKVTRQN